MPTHFIAIDLVKIYKSKEKNKANLITVLAWGDEIEVIEEKATHIKIALKDFKEKQDGSILPTITDGYILKASGGNPALSSMIKPIEEKKILQIAFVDVQQGDGCIVESPSGKVMLIDGERTRCSPDILQGDIQGHRLKIPK